MRCNSEESRVEPRLWFGRGGGRRGPGGLANQSQTLPCDQVTTNVTESPGRGKEKGGGEVGGGEGKGGRGKDENGEE